MVHLRRLSHHLRRLSHHLPFSTTTTSSSSRSQRRRHQKRSSPPPLPPSALSMAISSLPPRFSPSDLALAISTAADPRLGPHLLSWALHHHPHRLRPSPDHDPALPFIAAIKRLSAAGLRPQMAAAASLALSLPHLPLPARHLNTIIYHLSQARMLSKAIYVYKRMRSDPDPAARPNSHTYSLLFTGLLGREGGNSYIHHLYMDTIRMLFRQMVDSGVQPDRVALNSLVKGYAFSLHLNDALRVFHQMGPVYGVEPDECAYDCLVLGLCKQGRTRNARELFGEMLGKGMVPCRRVCNALVCALAMAGEVGEAVEVMWEVGRKGRAVDGITCRTLLEEVCRRGEVGDAVRLLREMGEKEMVDGWLYRELLRFVQDEFGDGNDGRGDGFRGR